MKEMPLELLYRLYKADIGDIIDNTYVRLNGAWLADDDRELRQNGCLARSDVYKFMFKDHSDGNYYMASNGPDTADVQADRHEMWYKEPFTTTADPFPVYKCTYETRAINTIYMLEDIPG